MPIELLISIISAIIALGSVVVAIFVYNISRKRENYQNLNRQMIAFFGLEMHIAIQSLWNFYRQYGEKEFVEKYIEIMIADGERIKKLPVEKRMEFQRTTLHFHRRVVSFFWRNTAYLIRNRLVPLKATCEWFSQDDVEIVSRIIIPIENRLSDHLGVSRITPKTDYLYYLVSKKDKFYKN